MTAPFLKRALRAPGYGWSRDEELYVPTTSEIMSEWGGTVYRRDELCERHYRPSLRATRAAHFRDGEDGGSASPARRVET